MSNVFDTFAHVPLGDGHATLAIRETEKDDKSAILEVAVSFCSPGEQFNKRVGRTIAAGRLNAKKRFYCVVERNYDLKLKAQAEAEFHKLLKGENVFLEDGKQFGWQTSLMTAAQLRPAIIMPRWLVEKEL